MVAHDKPEGPLGAKRQCVYRLAAAIRGRGRVLHGVLGFVLGWSARGDAGAGTVDHSRTRSWNGVNEGISASSYGHLAMTSTSGLVLTNPRGAGRVAVPLSVLTRVVTASVRPPQHVGVHSIHDFLQVGRNGCVSGRGGDTRDDHQTGIRQLDVCSHDRTCGLRDEPPNISLWKGTGAKHVREPHARRVKGGPHVRESDSK